MTDSQEGGSLNKQQDRPYKSRRSKYIPRAWIANGAKLSVLVRTSASTAAPERFDVFICLDRNLMDGADATNHEKRNNLEPSQVQKGSNRNNSNISLEEKIIRLQEGLKRASESRIDSQQAKQDGQSHLNNRGGRLTFASSVLYSIELSSERVVETDTFDLHSSNSNDLSLSSQLGALRKLLKVRSGVSRRTSQAPNSASVFPLELPRPSRLRYLLYVYFREMGSYFPFLDQHDIEIRALKAAEVLGYTEYDIIIDVDTSYCTIIALLCNIIAIGECMDPEDNNSEDSRPGWTMYVRGRKLLQHCLSLKIVNLDLVRYHTLSALYMINAELLQSASHALATAIQLAMIIRLNNQALWGDCPPEDQESRKRLWWTIYFLDRRISQRSGTPYLIRDSEVAVEEFGSKLRVLDGNLEATNYLSDSIYVNNYFQALINFSRVWSHTWDTFYAALAPKRGDWQEVEITDARILLVRRQFPPELTWDTRQAASYVSKGEPEPHIRRRLSMFIRINLLRMIIRQNPIVSCEGDEETRQLCSSIAKDCIDAIGAFADACPRIRSCGYFITTALVECIYHLVHILQDSSLKFDRTATLDSFCNAYQLLTNFAQTWSTAKRALDALSAVIFSITNASSIFNTISDSQDEQGDRIGEILENRGINSEDQDDLMLSVEVPAQTFQLIENSSSARTPISMHTPQLPAISHQVMQQEGRHRLQAQNSTESDFMRDLANNYGELEFSCSQRLSLN
ncbi:hypothetical protein F5884DRAFT_848585 [Xylogone sp. PMI_703]|nr:hypothetical protein F5884DRAFT_848585 [Xylogone sp. PMI_703]